MRVLRTPTAREIKGVISTKAVSLRWGLATLTEFLQEVHAGTKVFMTDAALLTLRHRLLHARDRLDEMIEYVEGLVCATYPPPPWKESEGAN